MPAPDATPVFTEAQQVRISELSHAIQSGVLGDMETGGDAGANAKHLRTGVNIALCQIGGLAQLLIDKGIIGRDEYASAMINALEREVARYEELLTRRIGKKVTLY